MRRAATIAYHLVRVSSLFALAVLSLLPSGSIHRTELGGHAEHLLAYAGTALVLGIGAWQRTFLPMLLALIAFAALLETLQVFVPGRTSQLVDFLFSAAGAFLGILIAAPLQGRLR
jgi:VanZ family protein